MGRLALVVGGLRLKLHRSLESSHLLLVGNDGSLMCLNSGVVGIVLRHPVSPGLVPSGTQFGAVFGHGLVDIHVVPSGPQRADLLVLVVLLSGGEASGGGRLSVLEELHIVVVASPQLPTQGVQSCLDALAGLLKVMRV